MLGALISFGEDVSSSPLFSASDALFFAFRKLPYFLPCLLFGMLFGLTLAKAIAIWGRDVGWFSAWNTLGACMGVLTALLVGYEMDLIWMIVVGVLLLLAMGGVIDKIKKSQRAVGFRPTLRRRLSPGSPTYRASYSSYWPRRQRFLAFQRHPNPMTSGPLVSLEGTA